MAPVLTGWSFPGNSSFCFHKLEYEFLEWLAEVLLKACPTRLTVIRKIHKVIPVMI